MKEYQYIVDNLKFALDETMRSDDSRGQYILKGSLEGRPALMKIVSAKNKEKSENLHKEHLITTEFFKDTVFGKGLAFGRDEQFVWYVKEFVPGEPLARYNESPTVALYNYDVIDPSLISMSSEIVPLISDLLRDIRKNKIKANLPVSFSTRRWSMDLEDYHIAEIEKGIGNSLSQSVKFYGKAKEKCFTPEKTGMCLGDLVPSNILYDNKARKVSFIDLEWAGLENREMDLSFLWLFLWRYPEWQKKLLNSFKEEIDEDSFRACTIRQIVGWYDSVFKPKDVSTEMSLIEAYRAHAWVQYLLDAGDSFEKLINVENTKHEN